MSRTLLQCHISENVYMAVHLASFFKGSLLNSISSDEDLVTDSGRCIAKIVLVKQIFWRGQLQLASSFLLLIAYLTGFRARKDLSKVNDFSTQMFPEVQEHEG